MISFRSSRVRPATLVLSVAIATISPHNAAASPVQITAAPTLTLKNAYFVYGGLSHLPSGKNVFFVQSITPLGTIPAGPTPTVLNIDAQTPGSTNGTGFYTIVGVYPSGGLAPGGLSIGCTVPGAQQLEGSFTSFAAEFPDFGTEELDIATGLSSSGNGLSNLLSPADASNPNIDYAIPFPAFPQADPPLNSEGAFVNFSNATDGGTFVAAPINPQPVPEPTSISILALAPFLLNRRQQKRS